MNASELNNLYLLNKERVNILKAIELLSKGKGSIFVSSSDAYAGADDLVASASGSANELNSDVVVSLLSSLQDRRDAIELTLEKAGVDV